MVTREFLLANGFNFRIWDGSEFPDGEYTKRIGRKNIIRIGYSGWLKWSYDIRNFEQHITFCADRQDYISIGTLQRLLELAEVELKLIEK